MEDFVPYELAVKLKEKGFKTENTDWCYLDGNLVRVKKYVNISPYEYAPTISQVLKWLKEKRGLFVQIMFVDKSSYYYEVVDIATAKVKCSSGDYKESPELAALAGIEYVIDNNLI